MNARIRIERALKLADVRVYHGRDKVDHLRGELDVFVFAFVSRIAIRVSKVGSIGNHPPTPDGEEDGTRLRGLPLGRSDANDQLAVGLMSEY